MAAAQANQQNQVGHLYPDGVQFYFFYHTESPFSQFHPSPIKGASAIIPNPHDDSKELVFPTSEHWMHYYKAIMFKDYDVADQILAVENPGAAKALGRKVKGYDENVWASRRIHIVMEGNILKFKQNPELKAQLMATGNKYLVEASPTDTIWGIGMRSNHPDAMYPARWKGTNLLGRILDKVKLKLGQA